MTRQERDIFLLIKRWNVKARKMRDELLEPVLQAIRDAYDVSTVEGQVRDLVTDAPVKKFYNELYPEVGLIAAKRTTEQIQQAIKDGRRPLKVKLSTMDSLFSQNLLAYAESAVNLEYIRTITGTAGSTAELAVQVAIADALFQGESVFRAQKLVEERVKQEWRRYDFQAARIARTEVFTAYSYGNYEAARLANIPMQKEWVHTTNLGPDDRIEHLRLSGTRVGLNDFFNVNGIEMLHPHDRRVNAPQETINCQCRVDFIPVQNE